MCTHVFVTKMLAKAKIKTINANKNKEPVFTKLIRTHNSIENLTVKGNPQNINNINHTTLTKFGKYTTKPLSMSTLLVLVRVYTKSTK